MFLYSSRNVFNRHFLIHLVCCCCFFFLQYIVHGSLCCQIMSYNFVIMVYFSTFLNAAICDHTFFFFFFSYLTPKRKLSFFLECILRNYNKSRPVFVYLYVVRLRIWFVLMRFILQQKKKDKTFS
jgi:hypothetical protein